MVANANSHKTKDAKHDEFRTQHTYVSKGLFTILIMFFNDRSSTNEVFWIYNR